MIQDRELEKDIKQLGNAFKKVMRKKVVEHITIEGAVGNFNPDYQTKFEKGDTLRIDWGWSHIHNNYYFCRFYIKKKGKESMCFVKSFDTIPIITSLKRGKIIQKLLAD